MTSWLELMLLEIRETPIDQADYMDPLFEEVGPYDHVVGIADESIRKHYLHIYRYEEQQIKLTQLAELSSSPEERGAKDLEILWLDFQIKGLKEVFWLNVFKVFPILLTKPGSIGVRKGWKIVQINMPKERPRPFTPICGGSRLTH